MSRAVLAVVASIVLIAPAPGLGGNTIKVPGQYATIQAGIDAAQNGDTVVVAVGIYRGAGNRDIDFRGKAITVRSDEGPTGTVIDCEGSELDPHRGFHFHSGETPDSRLEGFTITRGYGLANHGGGVLCDGASPTIAGNLIIANVTRFVQSYSFNGGGLACINASPVIEDNTFSSNTGGVTGGGIWCSQGKPVIRRNVFLGNRSSTGGAIRFDAGFGPGPEILQNTFRDNVALSDGGAIFGFGASTRIEGNTFERNVAGTWGGAICAGGSATITANILRSNRSGVSGGGVFLQLSSRIKLDNNLIVGNSSRSGGGIFCDFRSAPLIYNNTIIFNMATRWADGGCGIFASAAAEIVNCVVWYNTANDGTDPLDPSQISYEPGRDPTVCYSDVEGGFPGIGNLNANPQFVNPAAGNYRLRRGSPCIDAGDNRGVSMFDIDGLPRVDDPEIPNTGYSGSDPDYADIGAHERQGVQIRTISPTRGPAWGGTLVLITGVGFTSSADTAISFGGRPARFVRVLDSTRLLVITPRFPFPFHDDVAAPREIEVEVRVSNSEGFALRRGGFTYWRP